MNSCCVRSFKNQKHHDTPSIVNACHLRKTSARMYILVRLGRTLRLDIDLMPLSYNRRNAKVIDGGSISQSKRNAKTNTSSIFLRFCILEHIPKHRPLFLIKDRKRNLLVWVGLLQKNIQEYVQKVRLCSSNRCFSYVSIGPVLSHSLNLVSSFRIMAFFSNIVPKTSNFEQTAIFSGFGYGCDRMLS